MAKKKPLSYGEYLGLDDLLDLQRLASKPRQHDEVLFIIAHQAYELWFKLMLNELETAISHMLADDLAEATRLIRRVVPVQRVLIEQLEVLETIKPTDFLKFRSILHPASGFQSLQFRELEFISGQKDERYLNLHVGNEKDYEQLLKRWEAPSLWDGFRTVMEERGLDVGRRERGREGEVFELEVQASLKVFTDSKHSHVAELAEVMLDYDKYFQLWRSHHIMMVERVIGGRPGTGEKAVEETMGASFRPSGVSYLQTTMGKRFFPALWAARTRIGAY
ncbi:MAG: tryptophan 2,3-dioxygenase [Nitrososphaerota archaeon]|jgi:tryptophan 2,3-dioxygenase|nr:tryptophan 2,3-dioxygenase [Nitrososphaerota archaeon]MDG6966432.1 tryptophan 2,3-dioxygenase [Nitrososphaerota archaeon]MDG6979124.1 tryptophan 2,3-dioxygenase [Nitrososphaerota archaeon]MDG7005465.1 tryptophan 2,3-dioxygenase [Nitrososphaerota archaeon]MDG7021342.1 tryptophan 2,3-dioxygenase [Nitrososphaerota archaeon]